MSSDLNRVCLGAFAGAHGVHGEAKVKTFTEAPENITSYGPVETEDGTRHFTLKIVRIAKPGLMIVRAPELASREDAEALKGVRLYVSRDKLPAPREDEFYLDDLIGLKAVDEEGVDMGHVSAVFNFGAGDIIELDGIPGIKGKRLVAFTKKVVTEVDVAAKTVTVRRDAIDSDPDEDADGDGQKLAAAPSPKQDA